MADANVILNQTLYSQQVRNVLWFAYSGTLDAAGRQDIADYIRGVWLASTLRSIQVDNWALDNISIRDAYTVGPYATVPFTDGPLFGTHAANNAVTQVSMLASLINTGLTAPTRGRVYIAGVTTAGIDGNGLWPNSYTDLAETLMAGLQNGTTGLGENINLRICRRNVDGAAQVLNTVDSVIVRNNPATQRRRRIGVGG